MSRRAGCGMTADDIRTIVESFPEKKFGALAAPPRLPARARMDLPRHDGRGREVLGLSPAQVLEVVSFYTLFRQEPVGRHHIQVCRTTSCFICGAFDVIRHLDEHHGIRPGEVTDDGKFSLEIVECIALCHKAPAIQVNMAFHGDVTPRSPSTNFSRSSSNGVPHGARRRAAEFKSSSTCWPSWRWVSALQVVFQKSPLYAALNLIGHPREPRLVFAQLSAGFLAAVQVIVYAGPSSCCSSSSSCS